MGLTRFSSHRHQKASIRAQDSPSVDAFGRWRVSEPHTLFDTKLIFDKQPLFWDEKLESGASITSTHSVNTASTVLASANTTAGKFTRQTFMRFNYQSGKSQLIFMTGVLKKSGGGTGVKRRIGLFDDNNGIFFEDDANTVGVVRRSKASGSVVDDRIAQSSWNVDVMDGTGPSTITVDWSKQQIFCIDFEWLGVGRVRIGLVIGGRIYPVHEFLNANVLAVVYMSTPNLPLRYQMVTTGSSPVSTMECNCSTVISEGGSTDLGVLRYKSTAGVHVDLPTENTIYAIIGIRLKSTHVAETVKLVNVTVAEHTGSKHYEWMLILNPAVAGTFVYGNEANSAIQTAIGISANTNTVTGGTIIDGGFASSAQKGGIITSAEIENALRLGSAIDGTLDTKVLCVRPVGGTSGLDVEGSVTWREIS